MNRSAMAGLRVSTFLIVTLLLGNAVGWISQDGKKTDRTAQSAPHFHPGKTASEHPDPSCQSVACHPPFPHGNGTAASAFLNMHVRFVECLSCHGLEPRSRWALKISAASRPGSTGLRKGIAYRWKGEQEGKTDRHALLASPLPCRECHSEPGTAALKARGIDGLPGGFANPISLRMMEEGAKRWIPADMR